MKESDLINLCSDEKNKIKKVIFSEDSQWTAEIYSFGVNIRSYGFYPKFLPLLIYTDHGPAMITENPAPHELNSKAFVQFYHNSQMVKKFKTISTKPCYTLYSPFVFYRRKNKVKINNNSAGTLAFPAHSTGATENLMDWNIYIKQLKDLPEEFHPISVCLHMHDVNRGLHKIFMQNGFDVYTAGHADDDRFAERFYDILKKFKYSTSNIIGSYTYYAVEMGVSFFIYGEDPQYYNHWDPNIEIGKYTSYKEDPKYIFAKNLFKKITVNISEEQKKYVESSLGINDGISRFKMFLILYGCFFKYLFSKTKIIFNYILKIKNKNNIFKKILKVIKKITRPLRRKIVKLFE
jgi:hypothetical protein